MMLSLAHRETVAHLPPMVSRTDGHGEDWLWGQALKALRQRAGMTLAEAGDGVDPPMSGQAWGLYEQGKRSGIHQPRTQDKLTRAVQASRQDLTTEAQRLDMGGDPAFLAALGFDVVSLDALQARTGLSTPQLQAQLLGLELDGYITRLPGGLFQRMARG